jgi:hypothetical protein
MDRDGNDEARKPMARRLLPFVSVPTTLIVTVKPSL